MKQRSAEGGKPRYCHLSKGSNIFKKKDNQRYQKLQTGLLREVLKNCIEYNT